MRASSVVLVLLVVVLSLPGITATEPDVRRGAAIADACAACHGPNGRSQGAIPAIDKLSAQEFTVVLKAFRTDARQGTVMNRIAKGFDDADIEAMARYFVILQQR